MKAIAQKRVCSNRLLTFYLFFNLFKRDQRSIFVIDSLALFCGAFPGLERGEIALPPGKGAALFGTTVVDLASVFFEKDAVEALRIFQKRDFSPDKASELFQKILFRELKEASDCFCFLIVQPDVTGPACAALATARALKAQSFLAPAHPSSKEKE